MSWNISNFLRSFQCYYSNVMYHGTFWRYCTILVNILTIGILEIPAQVANGTRCVLERIHMRKQSYLHSIYITFVQQSLSIINLFFLNFEEIFGMTVHFETNDF